MIPLYSKDQIRDADKFAIENLGIPSIILMENASISIFNQINEHFPRISEKNTIGIICGKGNNGGDGLAVARHFFNKGCQVKIIILGNESELEGDVLINYKILKKLLEENKESFIKEFKSITDLNIFKDCSMVVDAMLGTGAKGELREPYLSIVKKVNEGSYLRAAIDIPTGLQVDEAYGEVIFKADLTVTLAELKTGLFFEKGYENCGKVVKGSIGLSEDFFDNTPVNGYLIEPEDALYNLPDRKINAHKYSAGKLLVIAGSEKYPGAATLTANSAHKVGAGAVILFVPDSVKNIIHQKLDISVVKSFDDRKNGFIGEENVNELDELIEWSDSIIIGPGLGREETTLAAVRRIIKKAYKKNIVLDADGCYAFTENNYKRYNLKNNIITPHHKEFADLTGVEIAELEKNITFYGKKFVEETGCTLVLKGAPTLVFLPTGEILVNSSGNSGMAKFGCGDVLTGVLGGILAQNKNLEQTVISGVYIHSFCADLLAEEKTIYGYTANDLLNNLPKTIKFLNDTISPTIS